MLSPGWALRPQRCPIPWVSLFSFLRTLLWNKDPLFLRTKRYLFTPCVSGLDLIMHTGNMCKQCSCLQWSQHSAQSNNSWVERLEKRLIMYGAIRGSWLISLAVIWFCLSVLRCPLTWKSLWILSQILFLLFKVSLKMESIIKSGNFRSFPTC